MGILTDYFRAPDADAVRRVLARTEGSSPLSGRQPAFDGVRSKGLDPYVVLGQLVAAVQEVPWDVDIVEDTPVRPPGPEPHAHVVDDDDPWATGPWVVELHAATRDTLAGVPDTEVPAVAARWARTEELHGVDGEDMQPAVTWLVGLARRARADGELLYCRTCL
ncbi:hypothetical protein [Streptomyces sp. NRRL B-24484]|uniref:hypothetical protein n=1 Tax=Streptomyces sp. NRRL B-24484 TaxID=1463833 RepID=UPI0004C081C0|nr:hypothetical protein [Streptomyces sp. NRRL B-24484]